LTQVRLNSGSGAPPPPPPQPNRYNHYETLGVGDDATPQEIKKAFYSLSKRCHPDLHPNDDRMAEKFKSLTIAYEVLMDKDKRHAYDIEKNIGRSNKQRWHGYSSNKYYPVAKGERPQVSYTSANVSQRPKGGAKRRFDSNLGDLGDSEKDQWIRQQHRKMKERLEEEDRQFKEEWKMMTGVRSGLTPGEPGFCPEGLTPAEMKRWQEFQQKLELRRKEEEKELAFQKQRIAQHPVLYYFYNAKYEKLEIPLTLLGMIGGIVYIFYVIMNKPEEEMPPYQMKAQFEEEGRLHKLKMAKKRAREKELEELFLQRALERARIEAEGAKEEEEEEEEEEEDEDDVVEETVVKVTGEVTNLTPAVTQNVDGTNPHESRTASLPDSVSEPVEVEKSSETPSPPSPHQDSVLIPV